MLNFHPHELFHDLLMKPVECGAARGVEKVASPASVIVGRAKPGNRHAKARCCFEELRPVVLQLPVSRRVPDLDRLGNLEQVIDVPVRFSR